MKTKLLSIFTLICCCSLSAQRTPTPRYGTEMTVGYTITEPQQIGDRSEGGFFVATNIQKYLPISDRLQLSGGLGAYFHMFGHQDFNSGLRFGCDSPTVFGGSGQQTYLEENLLQVGLSIPLRFHLTLGEDDRWNIYGGGDFRIPLFGINYAQIIECGENAISGENTPADGNLRAIIPEMKFGFGYGIRSKSGDIVYLGPYVNFSPGSHSGNADFFPEVATTTFGISAVARTF